MARNKAPMTDGAPGAGEEECAYSQPSSNRRRSDRKLSRWKIVKTLVALIPRQFTDEMELAKKEMQHRGKILGYAALFFAAAAVAALLLITALTIAMIAVIALVLPLWLSAFIVSAFLIVIIVICVLFGIKTAKKALPIAPELSFRGIALDRGALKDGDEFHASAYDRKKETKRASKEDKKRASKEDKKNSGDCAAHQSGNPAATSYGDLITRLNVRRDRMSRLRSQLKGKRRERKPKRRDAEAAETAQPVYVRPPMDAEVCQDDPEPSQQRENGMEQVQEQPKPLAGHFNVLAQHLKGRGGQQGRTKLSFIALIASGLVSLLLLSPKKKKKPRKSAKNSSKDFRRS